MVRRAPYSSGRWTADVVSALADAGRLAAWAALLFGAWAAVAGAFALRLGRDDLSVAAERGLAAASACAFAALGVLAFAVATRNYALAFVAQRVSALLPGRWMPIAVLSTTAGAMLAWAAMTALGAGLAARAARGAVPGVAALGTVVVAGAAAATASAVALATRPFALTFGAVPDGGVLAPDLQQGTATIAAVAYLVASAAAMVAFARTAGALAARALDAAWSVGTRRWNAVAWAAALAGAVAGARWYVATPLRGTWIADPVTPLWLMPCAIGAWLVHLDARRPTADRAVTRVLLTCAMAIVATTALAFGAGAPIRGLGDAAPAAGPWFGLVPFGTLVLTVGLLRRAAGAAARTATVPAFASHPPAAWLAHAGVVLLVGAVAGSWFAREHRVQLADTAIFGVRDPFGHQWTFAGQGESTSQRENYAAVTWALLPSRDGVRRPIVTAEVRAYSSAADTDDPRAVRVAYAGSALHDLFLETRVAVANPDTAPPTLRVTFVPLASWLVPGAVLLIAGTLVPLVARRPQIA